MKLWRCGGKKFWALSALQGAPMRCCGDSLLLVVPRHHPFEGCEGHNMCASTATHRAPWRADTNNDKNQYFRCWGGQQEPIHRDMNKSADCLFC